MDDASKGHCQFCRMRDQPEFRTDGRPAGHFPVHTLPPLDQFLHGNPAAPPSRRGAEYGYGANNFTGNPFAKGQWEGTFTLNKPCLVKSMP